MVLAMECTAYWGSVSSGSPGGDKSTAKTSQVRVGGHQVFFIYFISWDLHIGDPLSCGSVFAVIYRPHCLYYIYFSSSSFYWLFFLHTTSCESGKLYVQNNVARWNGCSHQRMCRNIGGSLVFHLFIWNSGK